MIQLGSRFSKKIDTVSLFLCFSLKTNLKRELCITLDTMNWFELNKDLSITIVLHCQSVLTQYLFNSDLLFSKAIRADFSTPLFINCSES